MLVPCGFCANRQNEKCKANNRAEAIELRYFNLLEWKAHDRDAGLWPALLVSACLTKSHKVHFPPLPLARAGENITRRTAPSPLARAGEVIDNLQHISPARA